MIKTENSTEFYFWYYSSMVKVQANPGCHGPCEEKERAPRRPCIWSGHAGAASAPPAEGRGAWPRRGVEEVRASRGRAAGPLLERRQGGPQPLPPPLASPLQPSGGPGGSPTAGDWSRPEAKKGLI